MNMKCEKCEKKCEQKCSPLCDQCANAKGDNNAQKRNRRTAKVKEEQRKEIERLGLVPCENFEKHGCSNGIPPDQKTKKCNDCAQKQSISAAKAAAKKKGAQDCKHINEAGKGCFIHPVLDNGYCERHQKYAPVPKGYKRCGGCGKPNLLTHNPNNHCEQCLSRGRKCRMKGNQAMCKYCAENGRNIKAINLDGYCGKHERAYLDDVTIREGKMKICGDRHNANCLQYIPINDPYSICRICRGKDVERSRKVRTITKELNSDIYKINNLNENTGGSVNSPDKIINDDTSDTPNNIRHKLSYIKNTSSDSNNTDQHSVKGIQNIKKYVAQNKTSLHGYKICNKCNTMLPDIEFSGSRDMDIKRCRTCREKQKIFDNTESRKNRDRKEQYKRYEERPEVIEMREKNREKYKALGKFSEWSRKNKENEMYRLWKCIDIDHQLKEQGITDDIQLERVYSDMSKDKPNINRMYNEHVHIAKRRKYTHELTIRQFAILNTSPCYYCGYVPVEGVEKSGIDRKDNNKGYTSENCVSCCFRCNIIKGRYWNDIEFIQVAEHILTVNGFINGKTYPHVYRDVHSSSYKDTIRNARYGCNKKHNIDIQISEDEFNKIKKNDCYLCHKKNSISHTNGVDRIDSDIGYIYENCRACCNDCNILKKNYSLRQIIELLYEIYIFQNNVELMPMDEFNNKYNLFWDKCKPCIDISDHKMNRRRAPNLMKCFENKEDIYARHEITGTVHDTCDECDMGASEDILSNSGCNLDSFDNNNSAEEDTNSCSDFSGNESVDYSDDQYDEEIRNLKEQNAYAIATKNDELKMKCRYKIQRLQRKRANQDAVKEGTKNRVQKFREKKKQEKIQREQSEVITKDYGPINQEIQDLDRQIRNAKQNGDIQLKKKLQSKRNRIIQKYENPDKVRESARNRASKFRNDKKENS